MIVGRQSTLAQHINVGLFVGDQNFSFGKERRMPCLETFPAHFAGQEIILIRRSGIRTASLESGMEIKRLSFGETDVLEDELSAFIQVVRTRREPLVSGHTGRKALAVALRIMNQIDAAIKQYLH